MREVYREGLEQNSGLKSLDLSSNQLKDGGIVQIASALSKNKALNYLNLCGNDCEKNGADALGISLSGNIALRSSYKRVRITDSGFRGLKILPTANMMEVQNRYMLQNKV